MESTKQKRYRCKKCGKGFDEPKYKRIDWDSSSGIVDVTLHRVCPFCGHSEFELAKKRLERKA